MTRFIILRGPKSMKRGGGSGSGTSSKRGRVGSAEISVEALSDKDLADAQRDPSVSALAPVMPMTLIEPCETPDDGSASASASADWRIRAIQADICPFDGEGSTVAVLDTGIQCNREAFRGIDLNRMDFTGTTNTDDNGHGTHCAGTIFGRDVQGSRIGVARGVRRALIGKVLKHDGLGESDAIFKAMRWALLERADVISISLGFDYPGMVRRLIERDKWPAERATSKCLEAYRANLRMFDAMLELLKSYAPLDLSPLVVAATGNQSKRHIDPDYKIAVSLPAAADGVLSVGAAAREGSLYGIAPFSNIFPKVAAPGVDISSAQLNGSIVSKSGTSMACAHAAGVAALWWQSIKEAGDIPDGATLTARIAASARDDVFSPGYDRSDFGAGMVTAPRREIV